MSTNRVFTTDDLTHKKPHISPSALDMYLRCGEQYRRAYVLLERMPPGVALLKGGGVHKGAEVNYAQKITSGVDLPLADLTEAAADYVHTTIDKEGLDAQGENPDKVKGEIVDRAVALITEFHKSVAPRVQPIYVETWGRIEIPGATHDILGRIDVMDNGRVVRDIKTAGKRKSQGDVDRADALTIYHAVAEHETGITPKGVAYDVLLDYKRGTDTQRVESSRTPKDVEIVKRRVAAMLAGVQAGVFAPAALGSWCCSPRFCGYWNSCPYVNAERKATAEE